MWYTTVRTLWKNIPSLYAHSSSHRGLQASPHPSSWYQNQFQHCFISHSIRKVYPVLCSPVLIFINCIFHFFPTFPFLTQFSPVQPSATFEYLISTNPAKINKSYYISSNLCTNYKCRFHCFEYLLASTFSQAYSRHNSASPPKQKFKDVSWFLTLKKTISKISTGTHFWFCQQPTYIICYLKLIHTAHSHNLFFLGTVQTSLAQIY